MATDDTPFCMQAQKDGINVSGIEEDLQAATDKYNKARKHVRSFCSVDRLTHHPPVVCDQHVNYRFCILVPF